MVDELVGGAYHALESDYEGRKPFIDVDARAAIETRLDVLRAAWVLLKDRADA